MWWRYIEMSTRIRYSQKHVIYNDLKFSYNYRYHHSPVSINFYMSADLHSISWHLLRLDHVTYSFPKFRSTPIYCGCCTRCQSLHVVTEVEIWEDWKIFRFCYELCKLRDCRLGLTSWNLVVWKSGISHQKPNIGQLTICWEKHKYRNFTDTIWIYEIFYANQPSFLIFSTCD